MSKKYHLLFILLAFLVILSACGKIPDVKVDNRANNQIAANQPDETKILIKVPDNVYKECPDIYFNKEADGSLKDCEKFGGSRVCSYYKETKKGQEKIKNLEYLTECHACRFYGQSGNIDTGTVKIELLGLEKKECSQGMYQD